MTSEETVTQVSGAVSHLPSESPAACRGAAIGFSLEISRCTLFSRLKFRNIRATRAPMFHKFSVTPVSIKVIQNVHGEREGSFE